MQYRDFLENGYRVFPLLGPVDADGQPLGPKEAYKRPRASGWQYTPLWSDEQLELMEETGQFATGYGVLCAGLLVIDIDARNGGVVSWQTLVDDFPEVAACGLVVSTGSGGGSKHLYFKAPEGVALVQSLAAYPGIDFKSSGFVVGPGSLHLSGARYVAAVGTPADIEPAPAALVEALRKPERHRAEYNGQAVDVSHADIAGMLAAIDPSPLDYEAWVRVGMAIHHALHGDGEQLWHDWSARSPKHDPSHMGVKWHSFGKSANPVTLGTLVHYAEQGGWRWPVTFTAQQDFDLPAVDVDALDTPHVDLRRPPGFVGEVCAWINAQCRYPRENLAVAAALVAVGNVIGLRFTDDLDGVTANLFAFGVAHSGTGKEAVLQAMQELMVAAAISGAVHGKQKSQQEIMRNLIRHQASMHVIDEIGIELQQIVNAQKSGKAPYLEGLIGTLMSLYSKANGFALLSGDVKEDVRKAMQSELAGHRKAVAENEDPSGARQMKAERLEKQLSSLDRGLERPFISMIGMTAPVTFDAIMTEEQATSGFIGRALLVREHDPNPRDKRPFKKSPMPEKMAMFLRTLYSGGTYDPLNDRVEYYGDRVKVSTTPEAAQALVRALDWFLDYAERQKELSGLEAIPRRGYELVSKVSLILAAPGGVRTIEHVRWAFALVKRDVDEKIRLVMSNDKSHGADRNLLAEVTKVISAEHGETAGVIKNKLRRKFSTEDVEKALQIMVAKGAATKEQKTHPKSKKVVERYYLTPE